MGFPSVCCEYVLLSLVNKEDALWQGIRNVGRKTKLNAGRKKLKSERHHVDTKREGHGILLAGHSLMVIDRLIEMG